MIKLYEHTDQDGDSLRVRVGSSAARVMVWAEDHKGAKVLVSLPGPAVAQLVDQLTAWLERDTEPSTAGPMCCDDPEPVKMCRWANQLAEYPNHHGCDDACCKPPTEPPPITDLASAAVYGDREADYGHPREDFTRQAIIWTGLLQHKLADGAFLEAEDIARCMIGTKLGRDVHSPKRDNRVDGVGYFITLDRLESGR
jgi:hypothetical protein